MPDSIARAWLSTGAVGPVTTCPDCLLFKSLLLNLLFPLEIGLEILAIVENLLEIPFTVENRLENEKS
jgi:hypothetical protein